MSNPFSDTKSNLKEWLKTSVQHFRKIKEALICETRELINEARKEYEEKKEKHNSKKVS